MHQNLQDEVDTYVFYNQMTDCDPENKATIGNGSITTCSFISQFPYGIDFSYFVLGERRTVFIFCLGHTSL